MLSAPSHTSQNSEEDCLCFMCPCEVMRRWVAALKFMKTEESLTMHASARNQLSPINSWQIHSHKRSQGACTAHLNVSLQSIRFRKAPRYLTRGTGERLWVRGGGSLAGAVSSAPTLRRGVASSHSECSASLRELVSSEQAAGVESLIRDSVGRSK